MNRIILVILCFISLLPVYGAEIAGTVIDGSTHEPIIGANVKVEGQKLQTVTDLDGKFAMTTTAQTAKVTISYVGYKTQHVDWKAGGNALQITLFETSSELDEVVVIGYGVQKKSDLTGAVSSIKSGEIQSMPTTSVAQALQGKASGVEVVRNSGAPGSSTSIRIRGMGTVNNSEPLYVVDGIAMDKIDYLSSDDIESIEVLKDAASAAIYGSRAANGVILVTTKKGGSKKYDINFSGYYGIQNVLNKPDVMSQTDYAKFSDYVQNQGNMTELNSAGNLVMNSAAVALAKTCPSSWWDEVTQNASQYKANLSISGNTGGFNYYLSGGIQGTDGIIKQSDYQRKSLDMKINMKLSDKVNVGANLIYSREDRTVVPEGQWGVVKTAIDYNPFTPIIDPVSGSYNWSTPVEMLRRATYDWYNNNLLGQLNLTWDIYKGLKFVTRASYTSYNSDIDGFNKYNGNDRAVGTIQYTVSRYPVTTTNFSWENIATYSNVFGKNHLDLTVGQTMEKYKTDVNSFSGTGYGGYDDSFDAMAFAQYGRAVSGYTEGCNTFSLLGRVSYNYAEKYLLQVNFRADACSRFAKTNRWGYFPSASIGWKLNEESFLKPYKWISLLKVRLGWGQLGNNKIGNYAYKTVVSSSGSQYIYGTGVPSIVPAYSITQYGNPNIKWERTQSYSAGLDFNILKNRLSTTLDFFIKDTKDMLIAVPIVYMAGYPNTPMQNAGSVRNKGFEFQASYKDNIGSFRYEVGGNATYVKNRVTKLGSRGEPIYGGYLNSPNNLGYTNKTTVGAPIACFYGWKTDGLMKESDFDADGNALVPTFASNNKYNPGDMKFVDVNKDGVIDDNDKTYLGNPQPSWYYSFNIDLGYKDFDLSLFFNGEQGNSIFNATKYFMYSCVNSGGSWANGGFSNSASDYFSKVYRPSTSGQGTTYRDHWGPNVGGTVPAPSTDPTRNEINFRTSDFYIESGSYLRLKQIQLTYTLPKALCEKSKFLSSFKAYLTVTNPLTFTKYSGMDPEVGTSSNLFMGIDEGVYPQSRSYTMGVIMDF
ncbi:MAG: TonB-dependent receptor [Muribaculaceae bacterium]|jgi:TonB-linked SusC/RagA family outer membrane protein|nr:TonB-dependent receptor [Muribaculaceae bacterium]